MTSKTVTTATEDLQALCRSKPELDRLLNRLETLTPIVRQQSIDAALEAERAYFESGRASPKAVENWRRRRMMSVGDLCEIDYRKPNTPEYHEFYSIGLAVAAFGGVSAISLIGHALGERKCEAAHTSWHVWDGMANHGSNSLASRKLADLAHNLKTG